MVAGGHPWNVSVQDAFRIQDDLKSGLVLEDDFDEIDSVAGFDVSFSRERNLLLVAVVVIDAGTLEVRETVSASAEPTFPDVPDLLCFREGPVVELAYRKLEIEPDLLMFDGQGIAHPRGLGLASHMGLFLDRPSIGCARSRLIGEFKEPKQKRGAMRTLSIQRKKVGVVLRSKDNTKPLFVSTGHRISVESAAEWVLWTANEDRLPKPIRLAHIAAGRVKR